MLKNYCLVIIFIVGLASIVACNNQPEAEQLASKTTVKAVTESDILVAIEKSISKKDFRLLHSKGRRIVVPGLEQEDITLIQSQCGLKPMNNSNDVMKTSEQRQQQKLAYAFAKQFNQAMYVHCLNAIKN